MEGCRGLSVFSVVCCVPLKGAQVDLQNKLGWTALMSASDSGFADVVGLLLDVGRYASEGADTKIRLLPTIYRPQSNNPTFSIFYLWKSLTRCS